MDSRGSSATAQDSSEFLLQGLVQGERARALRAQLASGHPQRSAEEIEEAVQTACERFLVQEEVISEPGQLYAWIRTVAHRTLVREDHHQQHELAVDPVEGPLERAASDEAGPEEELIALEDDVELEALVGEVASSLSERRREILALWAADHKRPEIAARLGLSERVVKRDLIAIMDEARAVVARRAGGGCESGEPLVLRFAYGLASTAEAAQARLHLSRCRRCEAFSEQLEGWREKAGALLPVPVVVEGASPGLLERTAHRAAHGISSVKQQVLGGGAQLKQQVAAGSSRSVDPTPLVAVRPGAVAAVVAGCIAVGGGATYCAQQGIDPLGAAKSLIAGTQEGEPAPSSPPSESTEPTPVVPPQPPVSEEPPAVEVTETAPPAGPETTAEPEPESAPPPPEASFEPAPPLESTPGSAPAEPASESAPTVSPKPAPADPGPQFGGP